MEVAFVVSGGCICCEWRCHMSTDSNLLSGVSHVAISHMPCHLHC